MNIKELLDIEVNTRNKDNELTIDKPDPLMVAKKYNDEYISLICALFAYGKASFIVKFLSSFDFSLLKENENKIRKELKGKYYRFQSQDDIIAIFIALSRLKKEYSLNELFLHSYSREHSVMHGIATLINKINNAFAHTSQGYTFLLGSNPKYDKSGNIKLIGSSPYKRWNMFLRWMVRKDELDMGLWSKVDKKDLILPLDTHTFKVSQKLGLLNRKTYDLKSAVLITQKLKEFDQNDPIKYDFALYRIGQEKILPFQYH